MQTDNLIKIVVGVAMGVLLLSTLCLPLIASATATTDTFDNSQFARSQMKALEDGDKWTRTEGVWYYNDVEVTNGNSGTYSVLFTDNLTAREVGNIRGVDVKANSNYVTAMDVLDGETLLELSFNETATTYSFNYGFGAVAEGDYIMQTYDGGAYVLKDTDMYITGVSSIAEVTDSEVLCVIAGNIKDGFTVSVEPVKNSNVADLTVGDITINADVVEGYVDLYTITNIQFTISGTYSEETVTYDATYSTFVLPKEITAEKAVHFDSSEIAMLELIPLLLAVALVLGVVAYVVRARLS